MNLSEQCGGSKTDTTVAFQDRTEHQGAIPTEGAVVVLGFTERDASGISVGTLGAETEKGKTLLIGIWSKFCLSRQVSIYRKK